MNKSQNIYIGAFLFSVFILLALVASLFVTRMGKSPVEAATEGNQPLVAWTQAYYKDGRSDDHGEPETRRYSGGKDHVSYVLSYLEKQKFPPIDQVQRGFNNTVSTRLKVFYLGVLDLGLAQGMYNKDEVLRIYEEAIASSVFPLEFAVLFQEGNLLSAPVQKLLGDSSEELWNKVQTFNPDEYTVPKSPELLKLEAEAASYYNTAITNKN